MKNVSLFFNIAWGVWLSFTWIHILLRFVEMFYSGLKQNKTKIKICSETKLLEKLPSVASLIVARHEPSEILDTTIQAIKALYYPQNRIYLLDDSTDDSYINESERLSDNHNIIHFWRKERHGYKAGIINDFLKNSSEEYIAIFDSDQRPKGNFLKEALLVLNENPSMAFIQFPTMFTNSNTSVFSLITAVSTQLYYKVISDRGTAVNTLQCYGTNVVFRRSALLEVGGFDENTIVEDVVIALKLYQKKYTAAYSENSYCTGLAPETLSAFVVQQSRLAFGCTKFLKTVWSAFFSNRGLLTKIQWYSFLLKAIAPFTGFVTMSFFLLPLSFIFFKIPDFTNNLLLFFLCLLPYVIIVSKSLVLNNHELSGKNSLKQLYFGAGFEIARAPVTMIFAILALFIRDIGFHITPKKRKNKSPLFYLLIYSGILMVNILGLVSGVREMISGPSLITGLCLLLVLFHALLYFHILLFSV